MTTKICTKCREEKEISEYYKRKNGKYGVHSRCKKCQIILALQWNIKNKIKYHKNLYNWRGKNPERNKEISKKCYAKNRDKRIMEMKENYRKNRSYYIKSAIEWTKNNPEKKKKYNRQSYLNFKKKYPEKYKAKKKKYCAFARMKGLYKTTDVTVDFLVNLKLNTKICPYCQQPIIKYHLDHKIPLSKGGTHTKENVTYCCEKCNLKKNNKTDKEFLQCINR